jgi:hypothetical protein
MTGKWLASSICLLRANTGLVERNQYAVLTMLLEGTVQALVIIV